jgi:hypothetical protein
MSSLSSLSSNPAKRVDLESHDNQVYLPVLMRWVDIQVWVQDDDNFCLNIAPFFVDTVDSYRTNYIGTWWALHSHGKVAWWASQACVYLGAVSSGKFE